MSPTQRTLAHLRTNYPNALIQVVEHWNAFAKIRQDLFHFVDVLMIFQGRTFGFQVTSGSNVSARMAKIQQEHINTLLKLKGAGWTIMVHGWRKLKVKRGAKAMKWELREEKL